MDHHNHHYLKRKLLFTVADSTVPEKKMAMQEMIDETALDVDKSTNTKLLTPSYPWDTFCMVPGRLSLLSNSTKYKVTVDEIQRRLLPPESLNSSLLGGILRKAKSKECGKSLRKSLTNIGVVLPVGRRTSPVTALTSLVEEESLQLANDFHTTCKKAFPVRPMAEFLFRIRCIADPINIDYRRNMIIATKTMLKELADVLNSDRSPLCGQQPPPILDPSIQQHLTHFSLITHGFGSPAITAVLDMVNSVLNESIKLIDQVVLMQQQPISNLPSCGYINHHQSMIHQ